jgi:3-dehydrosphinganine reductase
MKFENKLALITGGSSGIGLALAKKFAAQGAHVWTLGRDPAKLNSACQEITAARKDPGQRVGALNADVSNLEQVTDVLHDFVNAHGAPDLVVNSAGIAHPGHFAELSLDIFRAQMEVNYFGTLYVNKILLPAMIEHGSGYIVNISSIAGFLGAYGYSAYGPTKFAIRGLSDSMRYELKEHGIKVSVVFPPDTQTPQLEYENKYKPALTYEVDKANKTMTAEAVADAIVKGITRDRYIITPGSDSTLFYQLSNSFNAVYPVMDFLISQARQTLSRNKRNGSA